MHFSPFLFIASILAYSAFALPVTYPEPNAGASLFNGKAASKSPLPVAPNLAVEAPLLRRDGLVEQASILLRKRSSKGKGKTPTRPPTQHQPAKHRPAQRKVGKTVKKNAKNQRPTAKKAQRTHPKGGSQHPACVRRVHPRNLFGRAPTTPPPEGLCEDIRITLKTFAHHSDQPHGESFTETIKAGSKDLGKLSGNNDGVYEIGHWGRIPGPFIAKKFLTRGAKHREATNLDRAGHLIASGDSPKPGGAEGTDPWVVTKLVPGQTLAKTKEHAKAISSSKADCEAFLKDKHDKLVDAVVKLHDETGMVHGDLKDDNIHWEFDKAGQATAHLLDFGMMTQNPGDKAKLMNLHFPGKPNTSVRSYASHHAEKIYPISHCRGQ